MKVAVLGGSGMLGSMVVDFLSRDHSSEVIATVRASRLLEEFQDRCRGVEWRLLDADHCTLVDLTNVIDGFEWVINCIGVIKPHIHDDNPVERERAVVVNAVFPHLLARAAALTG